MTDPTYGPLAAAELVKARLADDQLGIPAWWTTYRQLYGAVACELEDNQRMPPPRFYAVEERARLEPDQYPAVIVVPQGTDSFRPAEPGDDGRPRWRVGYKLRVFMFARGSSYPEASAGRFRLVIAGRSALIRRPRLSDDARLDVGSWSEAYSDVEASCKDGSTFAGAYLEVVALVDEVLEDPPIGDADAIGATVEPLP